MAFGFPKKKKKKPSMCCKLPCTAPVAFGPTCCPVWGVAGALLSPPRPAGETGHEGCCAPAAVRAAAKRGLRMSALQRRQQLLKGCVSVSSGPARGRQPCALQSHGQHRVATVGWPGYHSVPWGHTGWTLPRTFLGEKARGAKPQTFFFGRKLWQQ